MGEDQLSQEDEYGGWRGDPEIIKTYATSPRPDAIRNPLPEEEMTPPIRPEPLAGPPDEPGDQRTWKQTMEDARKADYQARAAKARETRRANQKAGK